MLLGYNGYFNWLWRFFLSLQGLWS